MKNNANNGLNQYQVRWIASAHLLFLLNLTFLPGIAFLLFLLQYFLSKNQDAIIQRQYKQTFVAQLISLVIMIGISLFIISVGNWHSPYTWMTLIMYFLCIHSFFILLALFAWSKTHNGVDYRYPLIRHFIQ